MEQGPGQSSVDQLDLLEHKEEEAANLKSKNEELAEQVEAVTDKVKNLGTNKENTAKKKRKPEMVRYQPPNSRSIKLPETVSNTSLIDKIKVVNLLIKSTEFFKLYLNYIYLYLRRVNSLKLLLKKQLKSHIDHLVIRLKPIHPNNRFLNQQIKHLNLRKSKVY